MVGPSLRWAAKAQAGQNGGYILSPSDHFFDADIELIKAFVDESKSCVY